MKNGYFQRQDFSFFLHQKLSEQQLRWKCDTKKKEFLFAKMDRRKLLQKAQIKPGTKPQRAVTAIVIIESR